MKSLRKFLIALPVATALMFAQSSQSTQSEANRAAGQADMSARTYTGTIVDANCSQASALMGPTAGSYADRPAGAPDQTGAAPTTKRATKAATETAKKNVLRHCSPTANTTQFALLTDDGNFIKLDDTGNQEVISKLMGGKKTTMMKNLRASVTGTVQGDTLKVQSISKM